jgi:hypothetical protein
MSPVDLERLRSVLDELANALQVAIVESARLDQLMAEADSETSRLRNAIARCVTAIQSLQPRRQG